jgi:uncharacterized C2H2 Zn-finger protein
MRNLVGLDAQDLARLRNGEELHLEANGVSVALIYTGRARSGAVFGCPHCGYEATSNRMLTGHVLSEHKAAMTNGGEDFKCPRCAATFGSAQALGAHTRLQHKRTQKQLRKMRKAAAHARAARHRQRSKAAADAS